MECLHEKKVNIVVDALRRSNETRTKTSESDLKQPYPQRCSSSATAEPKLELLVSHIGENISFEFYADISFD